MFSRMTKGPADDRGRSGVFRVRRTALTIADRLIGPRVYAFVTFANVMSTSREGLRKSREGAAKKEDLEPVTVSGHPCTCFDQCIARFEPVSD